MENSLAKCQCDGTAGPITPKPFTRRGFLRTAAAATALAGVGAGELVAAPMQTEKSSSESLVKLLYDSLTAAQRKQVCFPWDHHDDELGLLRTRISANWHVTEPVIESEFYTADQQRLIREIFLGLIQPDWVARLDRQMKDDEEGFGKQSVAIFGTPGNPQQRLEVRIRPQRAAHYAPLRRPLGRARRFRRPDRLWPRGQRVSRKAGPSQ